MNYIFVTTSLDKRHKIVKNIREKLQAFITPDDNLKVVQSQVNKIDVHRIIGENDSVIIRSYVVIVIPVIVNFEPLKQFYGDVYFDSTDLINELYTAIRKLKIMQGQHTRRGNNAEFARLAQSLSGVPGEHRTGEDI